MEMFAYGFGRVEYCGGHSFVWHLGGDGARFKRFLKQKLLENPPTIDKPWNTVGSMEFTGPLWSSAAMP